MKSNLITSLLDNITSNTGEEVIIEEDGITYQGNVVSTYKNAGIYNVTVKGFGGTMNLAILLQEN